MNVRRINWPLWAGLLLTIAAFMSYFFIFVWFPFTRDFPWANFLLFLLAGVLLFMGLRRGFASDRPHPTRSKIVTVLVSAFSLLVMALFVFSYLCCRAHGCPRRKARRKSASERRTLLCLIPQTSKYL